MKKMASLAVFGLGYVGSVTAACFASRGHQVIGVDTNRQKLDLLRQGIAPVAEPGLPELVEAAIGNRKLCVTHDVNEAVRRSDASFISVGTPSRRNGDVDLAALESVLEEIGAALRDHDKFHTIVIRSTIPPGTTKRFAIPILEEMSGRAAGSGFAVYFNPEFLREGSSIRDFQAPPYVVIGKQKHLANGTLRQIWEEMKLDAPIIELALEEAEILKYACNAFHALKVSFANEIGAVCKELAIDSQRVMDVLVKDTQLNASAKYLSPGFAFGGSCLPKDVSALTYMAKSLDAATPLLSSIMPSNDAHILRAAHMVLESNKQKVCLVGLGFKEGTDDVRNSPAVLLAEHLLGKGIDLTVFDRTVQPEYLTGRNKQFLDMTMPHIMRHMRGSLPEAIREAEVVVICSHDKEVEGILLAGGQGKQIIDLVGLPGLKHSGNGYSGIAW
jgi:GDP-mannose 6-dehydrogenase